ncbi:MAG: HAD family phosphatase [Mariniphaga sp.]
MGIKNIIFDFGGVVIDWNPRYLYRSVFSDPSEMEFFLANICTPAWNVNQDAGYPIADATKELQIQHPEYANEIAKFYDNWIQMISGEIVENTRLLIPLKEKYRLFGLTNWSAETFPIAFEKFRFFKNFEGIVVSGAEKMIKPDPALFTLLLNRYNLKAEESLLIDDSLANIIAAKEMGFPTIHIRDGITLYEQLFDLQLIGNYVLKENEL